MFPFFILAKRVGGESTTGRGGKAKITTAERGNEMVTIWSRDLAPFCQKIEC